MNVDLFRTIENSKVLFIESEQMCILNSIGMYFIYVNMYFIKFCLVKEIFFFKCNTFIVCVL